MAHRLAMEAGDTFRAVVSVSGMMQPEVWEKRNKTNNVSFFQITGEKDDVVPKRSDGTAKYTTAPAIEDVMEYWAKSDGLSLTGQGFANSRTHRRSSCSILFCPLHEQM